MPTPTKRSIRVVDAILAGLTSGVPLAELCRRDGMPHPSTWRDWCAADEALAIAYARAREDGFDAIAVEALRIADDTEHDTIETEGGERPNSEWITRSRLRVDTRLKLLSKWDPKRYGDATLVKHADADGEKLPVDDVAKFTRLASIVAAVRTGADNAADDAS